MFKVVPSEELKVGIKIIVPISLNSKHFSTEKMQALVALLEKHNAVLLIADTLQKHNLNNEKAALRLGNAFLTRCSRFLKKTVQINTIEKWHKHKNETILKIMRWDIWASINKKELEEASKIIENDTQGESDLYNAILKVADQLVEKSTLNIKTKSNDQTEFNSLINQVKSNSIAYQKEEIKYLLTFSEFDAHLYPELNRSQNLAYEKYCKKIKLPLLVSFRIEPNVNLLFFPEKFSSSQNNISLAGRTLLLHFQAYITSSEISQDEKVILINFLNDQLEETFRKNENVNSEDDNEFISKTKLFLIGHLK